MLRNVTAATAKKKFNISLQLMPNKMISFPYEVKITHSDFCYYGIYYGVLIKIDTVQAFFYFWYYGIRMHGVA